MAQAHGDRLTAVDASFLAQETASSHMHVGAVTVFEGPAPSYDAFADAPALAPAPRPALPPEARLPAAGDRPAAVGRRSRRFNLEYHLRHTALPAPGSEDQLRAMAARIVSQQLDRDKPLWELWLVEGLEDGRFALISKTHHALVDGVAGVDLATVLFDLAPEPPTVEHPDGAWTPRPRAVAASSIVGRAACAGSCARRSSWRAGASARPRRPASALERRARPPRASARSSGPG